MKLRHLLFGVLAGVAFVACTNDNEPAGVTPVDGNKVATATKYMSVNFKMGAATRADAPDESAINDAAFLFFKNGAQVAEPFVIAQGDNDAVTIDKYESLIWDDTTEAVVVMENPTDIPTSLVVLINTGKSKAELTGKTIEDLQGNDFVADYSSVENGFVMSNAVYNDASNTNVIGAPVAAENVCETPDAARAKPVQVNVERVLAKVTVKNSATADDIATGNDKITVDILGWGLAYENSQSYLIKNLPTSLNVTWQWNDAANFRSYWADAAQFAKKTGPTYEEAAENALETDLYTQENTKFQIWTDKAEMNPTAVIVAAQLKYNGAETNLYKFRGVVYPEAEFKTLLADFVKFYKVTKTTESDGTTTTTYTRLLAADFDDLQFDATAGESYEASVYLKLAATEGTYCGEDKEELTAAELNEALVDAAETVEFWNSGASYYYVPIKQHVGTSDDDPDVFGVVRNHYYQLDIKSIKGLGTAVPNPEVEIVPETPEEKDYFIAAIITVLDWKVVAQDVNFGE